MSIPSVQILEKSYTIEWMGPLSGLSITKETEERCLWNVRSD